MWAHSPWTISFVLSFLILFSFFPVNKSPNSGSNDSIPTAVLHQDMEQTKENISRLDDQVTTLTNDIGSLTTDVKTMLRLLSKLTGTSPVLSHLESPSTSQSSPHSTPHSEVSSERPSFFFGPSVDADACCGAGAITKKAQSPQRQSSGKSRTKLEKMNSAPLPSISPNSPHDLLLSHDSTKCRTPRSATDSALCKILDPLQVKDQGQGTPPVSRGASVDGASSTTPLSLFEVDDSPPSANSASTAFTSPDGPNSASSGNANTGNSRFQFFPRRPSNRRSSQTSSHDVDNEPTTNLQSSELWLAAHNIIQMRCFSCTIPRLVLHVHVRLFLPQIFKGTVASYYLSIAKVVSFWLSSNWLELSKNILNPETMMVPLEKWWYHRKWYWYHRKLKWYKWKLQWYPAENIMVSVETIMVHVHIGNYNGTIGNYHGTSGLSKSSFKFREVKDGAPVNQLKKAWDIHGDLYRPSTKHRSRFSRDRSGSYRNGTL
jgi:hypothetical protein